MTPLKKSLILVFVVLFVDQAVKIWIKTHLMLGEEIPVFGHWFIIHFVENNGMAFGMELDWKFGKIFLSVFRIFAVVLIGWYLVRLSKKNVNQWLLYSVALVFVGAIGNIIDSVFYGVIFSDSYSQVATLFPPEGGYSSFLHGKVVDMLYFPIIEGRYPDWIPYFGGDPFLFFRPVFNVADSAITLGIFSILLFYRRYFNKPEEKPVEDEVATENNNVD